MHQGASLRQRKMRDGNQLWLKFVRVCVEVRRDLWGRKGKRRVRMDGDRAIESNFLY